MKTRIAVAMIVALSGSAAVAQPTEETHRRRDDASRLVVRHLSRGYLGVHLTRLTPELRAHFGAPEDAGIMVSRVEEGGPAETAGILVGDILTAIDGEPIESVATLSRAVSRKERGDTVTVELYRDGGLLSLPVTVTERERPVVDLSRYRFLGDGDGLSDVVAAAPGLRLDGESIEAFEAAMRELEERFDSPVWREKLERVGELDIGAIEKRMKEVERRLKQLEKELAQEERKNP